MPLVDGHASTETNFVFASRIPSDHPGTMGYLAEGADARIVDENDAEVPDGESGELLLRASEPHAFATGYFGMPEKTVEAWQNLWFHSGDRVVRDGDGNYRFVDRMKDSIRRRGENVSSWEVEQVLLRHPAIAACAIYPLRVGISARMKWLPRSCSKQATRLHRSISCSIGEGEDGAFRGAAFRALHVGIAADRERQDQEGVAARGRKHT